MHNRWEPFENRDDLFKQYGQDLLHDNYVYESGVYKVEGYTPEQLLQESTGQMVTIEYEQIMYLKLMQSSADLGEHLTKDALERTNVFMRVEPFNEHGIVFPRETTNTKSKGINLYIYVSYWKRRFGWNDLDDAVVSWIFPNAAVKLTKVEDAEKSKKFISTFNNARVTGILVSQAFLDWDPIAIEADYARFVNKPIRSRKQRSRLSEDSNDDISMETGNTNSKDKKQNKEKTKRKHKLKTSHRAATQVHSTQESKQKRKEKKSKKKAKSKTKINKKTSKTSSKTKNKTGSKSRNEKSARSGVSMTQTPARKSRKAQTARKSNDTQRVMTRAQKRAHEQSKRSSSASGASGLEEPPKKRRKKIKTKKTKEKQEEEGPVPLDQIFL